MDLATRSSAGLFCPDLSLETAIHTLEAVCFPHFGPRAPYDETDRLRTLHLEASYAHMKLYFDLWLLSIT